MIPYDLEFPEYLSGYEVETEAKGYLVDLKVSTENAVFDLTVYDPVRLAQELSDDISSVGYFAVGNVLVVPAVTREGISRAVERMARSGFGTLTPSIKESDTESSG